MIFLSTSCGVKSAPVPDSVDARKASPQTGIGVVPPPSVPCAPTSEVPLMALVTFSSGKTPPLFFANTVRSVVAYGRRPEDILFLQGLSFVVGSTDAEAHRKEAEIDEYLS